MNKENSITDFNEQQQQLIKMAKKIINKNGIDLFKTRLFETDCTNYENSKKFGPFKFKKTEFDITLEYALQILRINKLQNLKEVLDNNKKNIYSDNNKSTKDYEELTKNINCALYIYAHKLDNPKIEKNNIMLLKVCDRNIIKEQQDSCAKYSFKEISNADSYLIKGLKLLYRDVISSHIVNQMKSERDKEK